MGFEMRCTFPPSKLGLSTMRRSGALVSSLLSRSRCRIGIGQWIDTHSRFFRTSLRIPVSLCRRVLTDVSTLVSNRFTQRLISTRRPNASGREIYSRVNVSRRPVPVEGRRANNCTVRLSHLYKLRWRIETFLDTSDEQDSQTRWHLADF